MSGPVRNTHHGEICIRRLLPAGLLLLCVATALQASQDPSNRPDNEPTQPAIGVMSWNIRFDNPDDGVHRWEHRRERVKRLIESFGPDLIGFQEVLANQFDHLAEDLPEHVLRGVGRSDGRRRGEFSPIAYRRDRFEELDWGTWWLSETPDEPGRGWDAALPRIATWIRLRDRAHENQGGASSDKDTLLIVNTHFDHRGVEARRESAALLDRLLADEPRVILMGDFNAAPGSEPHRTLTARFVDAAGDDDSPTWTGWEGHPVAGRRIDWILLRGFTAREYRVPTWSNPERPESDHLPVFARVELTSASERR